MNVAHFDPLPALQLYRSERIGPITFRALLQRFGTAQQALDAIPELAKRGGGKRPPRLAKRSDCAKELDRLHSLGGQLLVEGAQGFPTQVGHCDGSPPILSVLGHAHLLEQDQVAIVGARNASPNGQRFAHKLALELSQANLAHEPLHITSGMARGIDAAAHQGGLERGSIAVLAGGVDVPYPQENARLYDQLIDQGAIVSEMPLGTEPAARLFPKRNRIIAALSRGVVLIEAKLQSGTLITARAAGEFGRSVFAVPGAPYDPRSSGCNAMIRDGAPLVRSARDVFEDLQAERNGPLGAEMPPMLGLTPTALSPDMAGSLDEPSVDKARQLILELLSPYPTAVDELLNECQVSLHLLQAALLELELAGRLERHPGNKVALIAELELDFSQG